jgi:hypothetical protein
MSHLEPAEAAREIIQFLKERGFVNGRMTP